MAKTATHLAIERFFRRKKLHIEDADEEWEEDEKF